LIKRHAGEIDRRQIGFDGHTDRGGDLDDARIAAAPLPNNEAPICRAAVGRGPRHFDPTGKSVLFFRRCVKPQNKKYFAFPE
jgi:hypothetical protein